MKKATLVKRGFAPEQAARIVKVMSASSVKQLERISPALCKWRDQCHHWPPHIAEAQLCVIDEIMHGTGVESLNGEYVDSYWDTSVAHYVNTGDTYETTILYDTERDRFCATSWGDWWEAYVRRHPDTTA